MQVIPALPWSGPEDGGKIKLEEPVTIADLNAQKVVVILSNGDSYYEAKWEASDARHIELKVSNTILYSAKLSEDGKTIALYEPQPEASNYLIFDVIMRDGVKLYPSSPLLHGDHGLLILPRAMNMEQIQASLYPILVGHNNDGSQNVGGWVVYPSDTKLYIQTSATQGDFVFVVGNVNTEQESNVYTSLELQPYAGNTRVNLVNVIETPSAPVMVPDAPWTASIMSGELILPEPMTFDDIKDGALVFATDYEKDGTHYDHFSIINQGSSVTLQMGANRAFDILSWNDAITVIKLGRAAGYEPAPLTAVYSPSVPYMVPTGPIGSENNVNIILPRRMTLEKIKNNVFPMMQGLDVLEGNGDIGVWVIRNSASGQKLFLEVAEEVWKMCTNVNTADETATYRTLQLEAIEDSNPYWQIVEVVGIPDTTVTEPNLPWLAMTEQGAILLPKKLSFQNILDGAVRFGTDYNFNGVHYDHFNVRLIEDAIFLTLGNSDENMVFDIYSFNNTKANIVVRRYDEQIPAPITSITLTDIYFSPALPWTNSGSYNIYLKDALTYSDVVNGKIKIYYNDAGVIKEAVGYVEERDPNIYTFDENGSGENIGRIESTDIYDNGLRIMFIKQGNQEIVSIVLNQ